MIEPTVGRVVWFYKWVPKQGHKGPMAAHVADIQNNESVNLMVIDAGGNPHPEREVRLLQNTDGAVPESDYCEWMPYQRGQPAKYDALEARNAGSAPQAPKE